MASFSDYLKDLAITGLISGGTRLDACTSTPTTYAEATSTYSIGNKTGLTLTGPSAASPSGRKATVPTFTGGSQTGSGTPLYWAITDPGNSRLLCVNTISGVSGAFTGSGNTFSMPATFDIIIPEAVTL